ncbi:MAG TPA: gluconate 2-dehydrogenase subunit 3 family protein [Steroidobacteraceae bacterium]
MSEARYPGYDVLAKRDGVSWNDATRRTLERRLAVPSAPRMFSPAQWQTLQALCARILPQPVDRPQIPVAALLDERLASGRTDGFRRAHLPAQEEAWQRGLDALDAEARSLLGAAFCHLAAAQQDALLRRLQDGQLKDPAWGDMSGQEFFAHRVLLDLGAAYYSHPTAWNEIGFGGPASPRGYVRMDFDRRDPWEAAETKPGRETQALRDNRRVR